MDAMSETQWIEKKLSEKTGTIVKLSPRQEGENTVFWNGNPYMVSFNGEKAQKRECALVQYILAGFEEGAPQEKNESLKNILLGESSLAIFRFMIGTSCFFSLIRERAGRTGTRSAEFRRIRSVAVF